MKKLVKLSTLLFAFVVVAALAACTVTESSSDNTTTKADDKTTTVVDQTTTKEDQTTPEGQSTQGEHVHAFNQEVAAKAYLKSAATCTEAATYYYSCECGEMSETDFFSYGEALGHDYGEVTVTTPATCTTEGKGTKTCSRCNDTVEVTIEALGHTFEDVKEGWTTADGTAIKYHCTTCDKYFDAEKNELEFTVPEAKYTDSLKVENGHLVYTKTPTQECAAYYDAIKYTTTEEVTSLSLAEAAANSLKVAAGEYSGLVMVSGKVAAVTNDTYGNSYLYVEDETTGALTSFYVYGACKFAPATENNFKITLNDDNTMTVERGSSAKTFKTDGTEGAPLYKAGDHVVLVGWIQNFVKNDVSTIELVKSVALEVVPGELSGKAHLTVTADENVESVKFMVNGAEVAAENLEIGQKAVLVVTYKDGYVQDSVALSSTFGQKFALDENNGFTVEFYEVITVKSMEDGVVRPIPTVETTVSADKAYRLGAYQGSKEDYYFVNGKMSGYYASSTIIFDEAVEIKPETAEGGFYLACTVDGAKKYVSIALSGTHVNFVYVDKDPVAFTYDADKKFLVATIDNAQYFLGFSGNNTTAGGYAIAKASDATIYPLNLYLWENRPEIEKVEISSQSLELTEGGEATLVFTYTPANANKLEWTWASTDETIATVANGVVTAVKAGETTITATSGERSFTVTVKVNGMPTTGGTVTAAYSGSTTNMADGNNAEAIGLDPTMFTVTSEKNNNSNHAGLNKNGEIRLYSDGGDEGANEGKGTKITITIANGFKITSVVVNYGATVNQVSLNGGEATTPAANGSTTTTVDGKTFTIQNVTTTKSKQVYIKSIVITYDVDGGTTPTEPTLTGAKLAGAATDALTLDSETSLYVGYFKMTKQWSSVGFDLVYSDNSTVRLDYSNATFSGDGICSARVANSTDTAQLFADSDDLVNGGLFCYSLTTETNYKVTINPETKAVTAVVLAPAGLSYNGTNSGTFTATEDGNYTAIVSLALYNSISFTLSDGKGNNTTLWYDNTTFTGLVEDKDTVGAKWRGALYHENGSDGTFYADKALSLKLTYNPTTKTMEVEAYFDFNTISAVIATTSTGNVVTFTKTENNTFFARFTLEAKWDSVVFTAKDASNCEIILNYKNLTFAGNGVATKQQGATWTAVLYSETDNDVAKGQFFLSTDGPQTYEASYDPATKTMTITLHVHEYANPTQDYSHIAEGYITTTTTCSCGDKLTATSYMNVYDVKANIKAFNSSNASSFTPNVAEYSVAYTGAPAEGGSIWCRFDFNACTTVKTKYAYVVLQGDTEGTNVGVKFDGLTSPNNNKYDETAGNKQWKSLGTGTVVVVWDLEALGMDSTILEKVVFWPYGTSATGTIKVLAAGLFNIVEGATAPSEIAPLGSDWRFWSGNTQAKLFTVENQTVTYTTREAVEYYQISNNNNELTADKTYTISFDLTPAQDMAANQFKFMFGSEADGWNVLVEQPYAEAIAAGTKVTIHAEFTAPANEKNVYCFVFMNYAGTATISNIQIAEKA